MYSIAFPEMFNSKTTNLVKDKEATKQNVKLALASMKRELACDPYFGSNLRKFLFQKNNLILKDLLIDDIFVAIKTFVPQLVLSRKDITITQSGTECYVHIDCVNNLDASPSVMDINLTEFEAV